MVGGCKLTPWHTPEENPLKPPSVYCKDHVTQASHYEDTGEKFLPESGAAAG